MNCLFSALRKGRYLELSCKAKLAHASVGKAALSSLPRFVQAAKTNDTRTGFVAPFENSRATCWKSRFVGMS